MFRRSTLARFSDRSERPGAGSDRGTASGPGPQQRTSIRRRRRWQCRGHRLDPDRQQPATRTSPHAKWVKSYGVVPHTFAGREIPHMIANKAQ